MIDTDTAILCILEYMMPDKTATAAQVAKIGKWSEEEVDEILFKLSDKQDADVILNNTNPITYTLVTTICHPEENDLKRFLAMR